MSLGLTLEERVARTELASDNHTEDIRGINRSIEIIRDDLSRRPSWAIAFLLSFLSAAVVGLSVGLVAALH